MKISIYSLLLLSIVLFSSCEDFFESTTTVEVPKQEPKLSVTALWNGARDDSMLVMVSKSVGALENENAGLLSNAEVTLKEDGQLLDVFQESPIDNGYYYPSTSLTLQAGKTYELTVSAPNLETVTASQVMPNVVVITDASYSLSSKKLRVTFQDSDAKDYYYIGATMITTSGSTYSLNIETLSENTYSSIDWGRSIFNDATFNGKKYSVVFDTYGSGQISNADSVDVDVIRITEDFYRFDKTYGAAENAEGPFSEPVILHRNFNKGYGVFAIGHFSVLRIPAGE